MYKYILILYVVNKYNSKIPLTHTLTICNLKQSYKLTLIHNDKKIIYHYKNDKLYGNSYVLDWKDRLSYEIKFIKGLPFGQFIHYFNSGKINIKANYHNGILNGKVKVYQYDEYYEMSFVKGKINGYFKYMKNNKLIYMELLKCKQLFNSTSLDQLKGEKYYTKLNWLISHIRSRLILV